MKLTIDSNIVYRNPQFSYRNSLKDNWEALKLSMSDSSPEFYQLIKDLSYDELLKKEDSYQHTVWKYFNRTRFRATPYGSFAGLGTTRLSHNPSGKLVVSNAQTLHRFNDWTCKEQVDYSFTDIVHQNALLQANSTYYLVGDQLRYLCFFDGVYELAELPADMMQLYILKSCKVATYVTDICKLLPPGIDQKSLLENMYNDQLLLSQYAPNIIGQDYFERIGFNTKTESPDYILAERKSISGTIDQSVFKHLPALVERLHQTLPSYEAPDLTDFIDRFSKRFGEAEVPLMVALDPELGLSYGGLHNDHLSSDLLDQLKQAKKPQANAYQDSTLRLLLPQFLGSNTRIIDLEQVAIPDLPENAPLPNTLPVLCSECDGMLQIEHIGGATANSLLGRFSLGQDDILSICHGNAQREQKANPEVLLFDIGYVSGNRVDNVNRRRNIYGYQLSILNYDDSETPLSFDDVMVSVKGGMLYLRSAKYNKRLIPKLASAYNYLLSDLPAFRLLCDLQHQGTHKNLYLRLIDRFPGLSFYPRVQFRNIILSPSTWRIEFKSFEKIKEKNPIDLLKVFFEERDITGYIRVAKGDQTLCIDTENADDLKQLWTMLSRNSVMHLEETFVPKESRVVDELGQPYVAQYMLSLYHDHQLYSNLDSVFPTTETSTGTRQFMPGTAWLYFQIFCQAIRADSVLTNEISQLLQDHQELISNWFFIRYTEDGNHIRLRINAKDSSQAQSIGAGLAGLLEKKFSAGLISDVRQCSYTREIERYGVKNIELAEQHFEQDSIYVMALLSLQLNDTGKYKYCCQLLNAVLASGVIDQVIFKSTLKANLNSFEKEHGFGSKEFKRLNTAYQEFAEIGLPLLNHPDGLLFTRFVQSFNSTLGSYLAAERSQIFSAFFHMHVNRLFAAEQRKHEAVIYYFMDKDIRKKNYVSEIV